MLHNYLKIAWRNLRKQKLYSLINVFGLATGIACCILIVVLVQHERSFDRFHRQGERLYRVNTACTAPDSSVAQFALQPVPMGPILQESFPEVAQAVRFLGYDDATVSYAGKHFRETVHFSDEALFTVFSFPLLRGDPARALGEPATIVFSQNKAQRYFGSDDPIGKTLTLRMGEQEIDVIVSGVMEDIPENSSIRFEMVLPMVNYPWYARYRDHWFSSRTYTYLMLHEGADAAALSAKLPSIVNTYLGEMIAEDRKTGRLIDAPDAQRLVLQPLQDIHLDPSVSWGMLPTVAPRRLYFLSAIALLVLLIACINFTTLAIARSAGRAREVGTRKVLGARRRQLMGQFWGEALLLTLLALLLGVALAELALPVFNRLMGKQLRIEYIQNGMMLLQLTGLLLLTGLLAGGYPALVLSGLPPIAALRERIRLAGKGHLSRILVTLQYALSLGFIICTLVMFQQLDYLRGRDLGFNPARVVAIPTMASGEAGAQLLARYRAALEAHREIMAVSGANYSFNRGMSISGWMAGEQLREAWELRVDDRFVETLEMRLREGRDFSPDFPGDADNAVLVNEALVEKFGLQYPVAGQKLAGWGEVNQQGSDATIIGVLRDYHFSSLHREVEPLVLHMTPSWSIQYILVRIRPEFTEEALALLEKTWRTIEPQTPFEYSFIQDDIAAQYTEERNWSRTVRYAALLAILIAGMGLFGLATLSTVQRIKEIGIRKVLGASVGGILALLGKDYLRLVLAANLLAWPLAYYAMSRWLENFAFRIELSVWVFLAASVLVIMSALLAVAYQAIRAALANPVKALRYE